MPEITTYNLDQKISILTLRLSDTTYAWQTSSTAWAKAERSERAAMFSSMGVGRRSCKFTFRRRLLTLDNAILWNGQHCFITDIVPTDDRLYFEVTAALIEPIVCSVKREITEMDDALLRPVSTVISTLSFPGCLTDKYLGRTQDDPFAVMETRFILVTPKAVMLREGELVTIAGFEKQFTVMLSQVLHDNKNEYEIRKMEDV